MIDQCLVTLSHSAADMSGRASEIKFKENIQMAECMAYGSLTTHQTRGRGSYSVGQSLPGAVIKGQQREEGEKDACEDTDEIYEPIPN